MPRGSKPADAGEGAQPVGGGIFTADELDRKFAAYETFTGQTISPYWKRLLHALLSRDTDDAGRTEEERVESPAVLPTP
jgi:hypothetical protein